MQKDTMMKSKTCMLLIALMAAVTVRAQEQKKFSPEKFQADLEAFITSEVGFSAQESATFFPMLREMHDKQRVLYRRIRQSAKEKPADDKTAAKLLRQCDQLNIEVKQIEQKYHDRMLKELPAQKVYDAINAESRFHRRMMKGWQRSKDKRR